ncbi:MAG: VCBS repeat-containing protein [Candidatus Midichloria sp.]|nr:VCBS repeat-containing protein [Candidatus Midichloria sp.]
MAATNHNGHTVSVLMGNGNGTFKSAVLYNVGSYTWDIAVGDLNNDGKPDIVNSNDGSSTVSVLLGSGDG